MLSKHPESCRFPHGHSRTIEVVVAAETLDAKDMVVDFKALKLALKPMFDEFDHAMAVNSNDPFAEALRNAFPNAIREFENEDPTTEVMARFLFQKVKAILTAGFTEGNYSIAKGTVQLERLRVWETASSWAEFSESTNKPAS